MTKKQFFNVLAYCEFAAAILYSLFSLSFHLDISLLAFPISVIFTAIISYFGLYKFLLKQDGKKSFIYAKLTEYLPFVLLLSFILRRAGNEGTPFWYDLVTVILWLIIFVTSLIIPKKLSDKNIGTITEGWKIKPNPQPKFKGMEKILFELAGWIDALVQAIFLVMLFQIFFFQLYEIPSESMVPTFLVGDRVVVSKFDCGPKFPLTDIGLPDMRKYKRGDTIVLRNPHYSINRKSEVKTVTSQLIYMLTLMQVNLNKDENGELKYDPLVKRITGQPGEQLVMQDGTLYVRTKDHDFEPVPLDNKFACWNLNTVKLRRGEKIRSYPLSAKDYENMIDFEEYRRNYDLNVAEFRAKEIVRKINSFIYKKDGNFSAPELFEYNLLNNVEQIAVNILTQKGGLEWFEAFMTSWIPSKNVEKDLYAESNYKLNVMTKICFGNLVLRYAELLWSDTSASLWSSDSILNENLQLSNKLNWYIQMLLDERNMPVFPACDTQGNPQYLPADCYFMMGDNRFNSMDLRHASDFYDKPLTSFDPKSVHYQSIMEPQYINKKYIIGKPVYRFWPLPRQGKV